MNETALEPGADFNLIFRTVPLVVTGRGDG